jgi:hypothetical protein
VGDQRVIREIAMSLPLIFLPFLMELLFCDWTSSNCDLLCILEVMMQAVFVRQCIRRAYPKQQNEPEKGIHRSSLYRDNIQQFVT